MKFSSTSLRLMRGFKSKPSQPSQLFWEKANCLCLPIYLYFSIAIKTCFTA